MICVVKKDHANIIQVYSVTVMIHVCNSIEEGGGGGEIYGQETLDP